MLDVEPGYYTPASDARKRWRIAQFATYADRIYALNPDLLHVLPAQAEFLPYANVVCVPGSLHLHRSLRLSSLRSCTLRPIVV